MSKPMDRRGTRGIGARMQAPHWIIALVGAALIVIGVVEVLAGRPVWIYVHLAAGLAAIAVGLAGRWVKPGIVVLAAVFVALYVVESVAPGSVGDTPDPPTNVSLILTGFVLLALMVALMLPTRTKDR